MGSHRACCVLFPGASNRGEILGISTPSLKSAAELRRVTLRKLSVKWPSVKTPAFWHWPNATGSQRSREPVDVVHEQTSGSQAAEKGGEWARKDKRKIPSTEGPCDLASSSHLCVRLPPPFPVPVAWFHRHSSLRSLFNCSFTGSR